MTLRPTKGMTRRSSRTGESLHGDLKDARKGTGSAPEMPPARASAEKSEIDAAIGPPIGSIQSEAHGAACMSTESLQALLRSLRQAAGLRADAPGDAALLDRWLLQRDELAFEVLVWRHGPMVLGVCQR